MSLTLEQLEAEASQLSPEERHALIDHLWDLEERDHPEIAAAWDSVISSRVNDVVTGSVVLSEHRAVLARLESKYGMP